jgi:adenine-specific DNA-methyltransferase
MSNSRVIDIPDIESFLQDLFQSNKIKEFAEQFANFFYHKSENLKKLNNSFKTPENTEYLSSYQHLGNFVLDNQRELPLILFHLQPNKIINDRQGKKTQFDIIKKWLKQNNYDSAIAIFVSNKLDSFRISYVHSIYTGSKRTFSHYKRYSFYVAKNLPNKTFIQRLSQYPIDSEKNIIELFSVDKLTKEFYEEIQTWYYEALKHVRFPEDVPIQENPKNATNLIRLLTRLIFCWFIKERGIILDKLFNPTELSQILKEFNKDKNSSYYYNAILQNLFFASLNTPIEKRNFTNETNNFNERKKHYGVKNLYRYKDFFNISKEEAIKLFQEVPFLNGGLFDCLDKEDESGKEFCIDGFTRKQEKQAIVPDWLFFHDKPITVDLSEFGLGKKTFRGLIDILKSYNFTTDENSPIDEEVALDPELLGHIFENLLASFNPETASTARKSSGSYYTPREIVDYMVTESLFYYFQTHCPEIAEDKIRLLLSYSDEKINLSDNEKKRLIEVIFKIKVLDPACGSGAFPMGVLHKLVFCFTKN